MYSVYIHILPNNKCYVGITRQKPYNRWLNGKGYQKQEYFYNAIQKYGWNNIKHEILFTNLTKEEAEQKEKELIALHKSNQREYGYNIASGGNASETVSEETKRKLSIINTGRKHTKEERLKMSIAHKGIPLSEAHKNAKKGQIAWNKGKETPKEVREKQRQAKLGKYVGSKHWNSIKVKNKDTGKIYNSFGEIAKEFNLKNASHIVEVCKGKRKIAYGFHWEYLRG